MSNKPTLIERAKYAFDNTMSRGTFALIVWLFITSAVVIAALSAIVVALGLRPAETEEFGFGTAMWWALMRTLDSGTMGGDEGSPLFLTMMLASTFCGIFLISTLIGVITSGIEAKVEELRKGRSRVLTEDHTVVLGWNSQIFSVITEIVAANESRKKATIVVLAPTDKVEMEEAIADHIEDLKTTTVICRSGNPIEPSDLSIASIQTSRSVIILSPEGEDSDAEVIKTLLAIINSPERRPEPYHVVAQIQNRRNLDVARMVAGEEAELILVGDLIARIVAQTCRQSGLSVVYTELLDFGGDEIYMRPEPSLAGRSFGEALFAYEDCAVIGIQPANGPATLNPPMDRVLTATDHLVLIAQDDDAIRRTDAAKPDLAAIHSTPVVPRGPESTLILGWDDTAIHIIRELDAYVAEGSRVTIVDHKSTSDFDLEIHDLALKRQRLRYVPGDFTDRGLLDELDIPTYDHVVLLSPSDVPVQKADARTLVALLHLRDIREKSAASFSIVSEMLDIANRRLAEVTQADDFIVGTSLISLMMTQLAENKRLSSVFADLFDADGSEIYIKPAALYVRLGQPVNYATVVEAARRRGETAIGFRIKAQARDAAKAYGVRTNPKKGETITFVEGDSVIVLAED